MVGDGSMMPGAGAADVGIALVAADVARETADVTILREDLHECLACSSARATFALCDRISAGLSLQSIECDRPPLACCGPDLRQGRWCSPASASSGNSMRLGRIALVRSAIRHPPLIDRLAGRLEMRV